MLKWLILPQVQDEYQNFAYQALGYTLICLMLLITPTIPLGDTVVHRFVAPLLLVFFGFCYFLLIQNRLRIAGTLFLSALWVLITVIIYSLNGINNASFFIYVIPIIYANLLFSSRRLVIAFTVMSCTSGIILTIGQVYGVLPLRTSAPILFDRIVIAIGIFVSTAILLSSAARVLRKSMEHLQESRLQLKERNRELERLAEHLKTSEERYRLLFENSGVMTAVYDEGGKVLLTNRFTATVLDRHPEELIGRTLQDIFGDSAEDILKIHQDALEQNKPILVEGNATLPSGRYVEYLRHVIPLPKSVSSLDNSRELLVLATDITETKQAEKRERELSLAQEKIDFFTDFFGTISHDIKTPLSVIDTSLYLIEKSSDEAKRQEKLDRIRKQVRAIESYIQDMLMISRLEQVPELNKSQVQVKPLIEGVVDVHKPKIEDKAIECTIEIKDGVAVEADAEQLQRALSNLVENAVNYSSNEGRIQVEATQQADILQIEIIDSGMGIHDEDIPHIFERFYRAREAKSYLSSGTGLGLAIVKKIVDLHQGDITVSSTLGEGTSFTIRLPHVTLG